MIDFGSSDDSDFVQEVPARPRRSGAEADASGSEAILELPPSYLVELAKSGRAECKRCNNLIANKDIRIGIIVEGDWGIMTRWQHLTCTVFHKAVVDAAVLDGFQELTPEDQKIVQERVKKSLSETDQDDIPIDPNELVRVAWTDPVEPPADLRLPLLPYQKEGLGWMLHQEHAEVHGGILADEMGMGKTIQAIALVLGNNPNVKDSLQCRQWRESDARHGYTAKGLKGNTLIVVPTIALRQWESEISRFTRPGSLDVYVYHGGGRETNSKLLCKADVVLTTYKILEIEHRKATAGTKIECRICKKKFYPEKLRVHRKYFCGAGAERTEAQSKTQVKRQRLRDSDEDSSGGVGAMGKPKGDKTTSMKGKGFGAVLSARGPHGPSEARGAPVSKSASSSRLPNRQTTNEDSDSDSSDSRCEGRGERPGSSSGKRPSTQSNNRPSKINRKMSRISSSRTSDGTKEGRISSSSVALPDMARSRRSSRLTSSIKKPVYVDESGDESSSHDQHGADSVSSGESGATASSASELSSIAPIKGGSMSKAKRSPNTEARVEKEVLPPRPSSTKNVPKGAPSEVDVKGRDKKENVGKKSSKMVSVLSDNERDVEIEIREALLWHQQQNRNRPAAQSVLHEISWFRIILDEAHLIKDRSTSTSHACFALTSLNKWCLTGTPLQNRVGELYSLVRFLRLDPHAFYYCRTKGCSCKSLHYRFTQGRCDDCNHTAMQHFCHFNKHILNPIKRSGYVSEGRRAMMKLKEQILDCILLRRTKAGRADDIMLPARFVSVRQEPMDEREADFYEALYTQSKAQFNTYVAAGTVLNNYAHIFDILIRLRQAADHPYLVIYSETIKDYSGSVLSDVVLSSIEAGGKQQKADTRPYHQSDCALCHEPAEDPRKAKCGHVFCLQCALELVQSFSLAASEAVELVVQHPQKRAADLSSPCLCPQCDKPLTIPSLLDEDANIEPLSSFNESKFRKQSILSKIELNKFQSSTKLEALLQELHKMECNDPGAKAIVFSQFVNMLDLIAFRLQIANIGCAKLLGFMTVESRDQALKSFNNDPNVKVLLISLKTGGVALNLTVANYIFLMDPWWNPAAEMQAIDRAHRIGQNKPIYATRFIIKDSIEERILKLQEKKQLVFEGTVGGDASSMARLTVDDMRFLFQ